MSPVSRSDHFASAVMLPLSVLVDKQQMSQNWTHNRLRSLLPAPDLPAELAGPNERLAPCVTIECVRVVCLTSALRSAKYVVSRRCAFSWQCSMEDTKHDSREHKIDLYMYTYSNNVITSSTSSVMRRGHILVTMCLCRKHKRKIIWLT